MKTILLPALAMALLALTGCEKDSNAKPDQSEPASATGLQGSWELRAAYGGYTLPNTNPNYAPGNGRIWVFTDSSYALYAKSKLMISGPYQRTRDISPATGNVMDAIIMPQNGNVTIHYQFSKDTLVMYHGTIAADGTIEKYVPVQPPVSTSK